MRLTHSVNFFLLILTSSFFFFYSCRVEECPCVSNSPVNGRWYGKIFSQTDTIELIINLNESNTNISGSGNFLIFKNGFLYEFLVTCQGNFVSNKITLSFQGIDSLYYEGSYISKGDSISGKMFYKTRQLPFGLKKFK